MQINQDTLDLIKEFEGFRAKAYKCPAGVWTIGYGTTAMAGVGIDPKPGMTVTEEEAEDLLEKTLEKFGEQIRPAITAPINNNEYGAFLSLAYNIGTGAFRKSSALRLFNAGDKAGAAKAILMWNKAGGKVLAGLTRRREAEKKLFLTPVQIPDTEEMARAPRTSLAQSKTLQASTLDIATKAGAGVTALAALDGNAQYIVLGFLGVSVLFTLWIMRERLQKWAEGVR
jgi:lysozyme